MQKASFRNSFIGIHQAQSRLSIVYAHNGDLCQVAHMDAVVCGMQTSIASGSGLACATQGIDSSRLYLRELALGVW